MTKQTYEVEPEKDVRMNVMMHVKLSFVYIIKYLNKKYLPGLFKNSDPFLHTLNEFYLVPLMPRISIRMHCLVFHSLELQRSAVDVESSI